jgi:uncharacterized membrane protein
VSAEGRLSATMEVLTRSVRPGDELPYRITNTGSVELICGVGYRMERETSDGWIHMNPGMAFRSIGFGVLPGEHRDLSAMVPADAPAGSYRISTSVTSDHVEGVVRLSAGFEVQPIS